MKKRWMKIPFVIAIGALALFVFSGAVMFLWNHILPGVFHIGVITLWQAAGILLLCRLLFGGFKGRHGRWRGRKQMFGQWQDMTPEEKELFKQRAHCCR